MDKDEIIDMINVGIKGVLEKHIDEKNDGIFRAMRANEENCILVNFHEKQNMPIYGIHELFYKLAEIPKQTKSYIKFKQTNLNEDEFNEMVKEEADIRRIKGTIPEIANSFFANLPIIGKKKKLAIF